MEALRGGAGSLVTSLLQRLTAPASRPTRLATIATAVGCMAATLTLGAGASRAQALDNGDQRDFSIQVGAYIPSNSIVRAASATEIPMVEASYIIQKYPESHFISQLSVGFAEHEALRLMPITVSQIYRDPNNAAGVNYYYGIGVGVYYTRLNLADTDDRVKPEVGGFVVAGLDLTKTIYAEAKYNVIEHYDSNNVGGTELSLGLRF